MAGADQPFGGGWWSVGDPQNNTFTDNDSSLYSKDPTFNHNDALDQRSHGHSPRIHHGELGADALWLPIPTNPDIQTPPFIPPTQSTFSIPRPSFHTAPPHLLPPSQVHGLRGYYTDPQPRGVQRRDATTLSGLPFGQAAAVESDYFMAPEVGDTPGSICNDTAVSLINAFVKLYPTTFFYPEKVEALAILTSVPSQAIQKSISQLLEEGLPGSSHVTSSSKHIKSSVTPSESLRTVNRSLSLARKARSRSARTRSARTTKARETQAIFERRDELFTLNELSTLKQAAQFLSDDTARKCRPTSDKSLFSRDDEKIYQCTFKCGASFTRKGDLKRHEEEKNYPPEGWICDVEPVVTLENITTCAYCRLRNPPMSHAQASHRNRAPFCHAKEIGAWGKIFTRKKRFIEHYKAFHPALPVANYLKACHFVVQSKFPKWCGFCEQCRDFHDSKARIDHMASHFEDELDMSLWRDPPTSTVNMDEDDNTDGGDDSNNDVRDKMDENDDANYDIDGHEDHDTNSHEPQRKGGSSSGTHAQNKCEGFSNSVSALSLDDYSHNGLKRDTCGAGIHGAVSRKKPSMVLTQDKVDYEEPCITSNDMPGSFQQNTEEDIKLQRARNEGTELFNLEMDLWNARITYKSHGSFIPLTELNRLITLDSVCHELQRYYPMISSSVNARRADIIVENASRLFALLVLIEKGDSIMDFIEEGIKDDNLPIGESRYKEIRAFARWKPKAIEDFKQDQWSLISPVFDTIGRHYKLDDHTVLPFIEDRDRPEQMKTGGYSDVWSVRIHPAHQKFFETGSSNSAPLVAVKRLHSADSVDFEREVSMLKELSKKNHPNIVKLLATYQIRRRYHLIFPWADKNLRTYWGDDPKPELNAKALLWNLQQMQGIASGLQTIHGGKLEATDGLALPSDYSDNYRFGRHGDIKPENILWRNEGGGSHGSGILQIADFGLGRFHSRGSRSNVQACTVVSTPTYEPPEMALSQKISRAYDMWSLGCVYLEFITWILGGYKFVEAFSTARVASEKDWVLCDNFYTVREDAGHTNAFIRPAVLLWIKRLHSHERCSGLVHDMLDLVQDELLVVNAEDRLSSQMLVAKLRSLARRAKTDKAYLLSPTPHDNVHSYWRQSPVKARLSPFALQDSYIHKMALNGTAEQH